MNPQSSSQSPQALVVAPASQTSDMSQALVATPSTIYDPLWYPDSGASHHLTLDLSNFSSKSTYDGGDLIQVGNGAGMRIQHVAHSNLLCHNSHSSFSLNNLLHVPGLTKNLLNVSQLCKDNGVYFEFHSNSCCVKS